MDAGHPGASIIPLQRWQRVVADSGLDGWLIADFRWNNPLFARLLGLQSGILSRRSFLWLPASGHGGPHAMVSRTDGHTMAGVPYDVTQYSGFDEMVQVLRRLLPSRGRVAMEYTPRGVLPTVSRVDAGMIELIRSFGIEVESSGSLIAALEVWDERQQSLHRRAARGVDEARRVALDRCAAALANGEEVSEGSLSEVIRTVFRDHGLTADHGPDVAVGPNSADPHYSLAPGASGAEVSRESVLLIDLFARVRDEIDAPYADSTWMAYIGRTPPADLLHSFDVVRDARDRGVSVIDAAVQEGRTITGREVDRLAREPIQAAGLEHAIVHRTGHSLGIDHVHGIGTNLDDIEFPDDRELLAHSGFTVEPGLYFPGRFGIRSEVSAILHGDGAEITTENQRELTLLDS